MDRLDALLPSAGAVVGGRYRIVRELGRGGMGIVFEAEHVGLAQRYALKVLHPREIGDDAALRRFEREARIAAKLDSPYLVRVIDVARTDDGLPYLVMELLDGADLSERLASGSPVEARDAVAWMMQVAAAMVVAHEAGVVHRDLKPSNVFLMRRSGKVKVLDFGVATFRSGSGDETSTKSVAGTPRYMAPEQLLGRPPDPRSDLWAIGVMLYRMLAGRHPFEATTTAGQMLAIQEGSTPLAELAPELPPALAATVERALAISPEARWPTARELLEALTPFGSMEVRPSALPPPMSRDAAATVPTPKTTSEVGATHHDRAGSDGAGDAPRGDASVDVALSSSQPRDGATERSAPDARTGQPGAQRPRWTFALAAVATIALGTALVASRSSAPPPSAAGLEPPIVGPHPEPEGRAEASGRSAELAPSAAHAQLAADSAASSASAGAAATSAPTGASRPAEPAARSSASPAARARAAVDGGGAPSDGFPTHL